MGIEGKWWVLYEEEPIDMERTAVYDLRDGLVHDGRTGDEVGRYEVAGHLVRLTFAEKDGRAEVVEFMAAREGQPANLDAARYSVNFTTAEYQAYQANLAKLEPISEAEQEVNDEWAFNHFGLTETYGSALRDSPYIQECHDENQRVLAAG